MTLKRITKNSTKTASLLKVQSGSDLLVRFENISEQTGLSHQSLLQKWILQEETLIGLMQRNRKPMKEQAETKMGADPKKNPAVQKEKAKTISSNIGNPNYRETLVKKAQKLKKEGMSLKKIAESFNEEKVLTVSGTGKWYSSSIANLLKIKK